MKDRPMYTKWSRKAGGVKVCPNRTCKHRHPPVMRIDGKATRPKVCQCCGTALPGKLTYPKKAVAKWYVREFDPATGKQRDFPVSTSEAADELIRQKQRDFTRDPVQEELIEEASVLIRRIGATDRDDAVNQLIVVLGGDASARTVKPIGWDEARDTICDELRQKGKSGAYIDDVRRITRDFGTITELTEWSAVDLDAIVKYRSVRMTGGWQRNERVVKAVRGRAINKDLATLSAFLARAVRKNWISRNPLEGAKDERVKVKAVRVKYMPDDDLRTLVEAAEPVWLRALVIVAYYTGARRGDLLRLEWERDIDFDGSQVVQEKRVGPHIYVQGAKADTPHWMPLHPAAVMVLRRLRLTEPVIDPLVFPVKGYQRRGSRVSTLFGELCIKAGLVETVERNGKLLDKNRWTLHDLRRKANTDLRNRGASPKERMALLGHRTAAVNEAHYEAVLPDRERELIDGLPAFGMTA